MLVKGMDLPKASNAPINGLRIPFNTLEVGDAWKVDMEDSESTDAYNLLRQRVFRASKDGRKFATRKKDGAVYVFRTK